MFSVYDLCHFASDKYGLLIKRDVKMAGYWPFFCVFMDRDEVEVLKHEKKANIQPSLPNKLSQ